MIFALALLAAFVFGSGVVLQQRAALEAPREDAARPALLVRMFQRPLWLLGLIADIGGFGLQAAALHHGSLIVVQPLITTSLLFTLVLTSAWYHQAISAVEWAAVGLVLAGLSVFLIVAAPSDQSVAKADAQDWFACSLAVTAVAAIMVLGGLRTTGRVRAGLFGVAAGIADAFMAVLAKTFAGSFDHGVASAFWSWTPFALVAAGLVTLLLISTAYQAGHPTVALPIITVTDPLVGSLIGITLFDEHLALTGTRGPVVVAALIVTVLGILALGRDTRLASVMADEAAGAGTGATACP